MSLVPTIRMNCNEAVTVSICNARFLGQLNPAQDLLELCNIVNMACCFTTVSTSEVALIERFGKFNRLGEVRHHLPLKQISDAKLKISSNNTVE